MSFMCYGRLFQDVCALLMVNALILACVDLCLSLEDSRM